MSRAEADVVKSIRQRGQEQPHLKLKTSRIGSGKLVGDIQWGGIMNEVGARYTAQMRAQRGKAWRHGITKPIEYGEQTKLLYKGGSTKPPKRRPGEETEDYNRRVRDSISRVEATAGNLKPGVDKKQARAAYQLIADLEDRKREGKRMYRGMELEPQLQAEKKRYKGMLRREQGAGELDYPQFPKQLTWGQLFPEVSEERAMGLSGANRCDMCARLKSDCGQIFKQGLFNLCSECCTSPERKKALQQGLSLYSPRAQAEIKKSPRWGFLGI